MIIDILITNYNMKHLLMNAINSVKDCKLVNKIIVFDDGSNDGSLEMLSNLNLDNLDIYSLNENRGFGFGRNYVLNKSKSQFVVFLDADDEIINPDDLFAKCYETMNTNPDLDVLYLPVEINSDEELFVERLPSRYKEPVIFSKKTHSFASYGRMYKREFFRRDTIKNDQYRNVKEIDFPEIWFDFKIWSKINKFGFMNKGMCNGGAYRYNHRRGTLSSIHYNIQELADTKHMVNCLNNLNIR